MVTQVEPIKGKIAKVLNSREVALNIGEENGVTMGMVFEILSANADVIHDPDTGVALGSVEQPKTRVKVKRAYDKFAVATTYRSREVNVGGSGLGGLSLLSAGRFSAPKWETRYETLKSNGGFEPISEALDEKDSYVNIGDRVVQIIDGE